MDPHTLELLAFSSILNELRGFCFSAQGSGRLDSESIDTSPKAVQERKQLTSAFRRLLESGKIFPTLDFPDLGPLLPRLSKTGSQFEPEELSSLGRYVVSSLRLKRHILAAGEESLQAIAALIPDLRLLTREIFAVVDREGALREDHIPELRSIRERIRALQREAERLAQGYLHNAELRPFWQSEIPSQKNGRMVLPLKANFKGRIPGIVHDVSATGATLFLEPLDIVEKNNEVTEQENRYRREVHRILRALSARVTAQAGEINAMIAAVSELDTLYARASHAIQHRCIPAEAMQKGLRLVEARHPLLGGRGVPISLSLDDAARVLIITGPNTGGKTVTLKTVGLLALMNQFGMEIPALEGSGLAVFDNVLADIGDEQSIEQSLSTFSAHIINAARMIRSSTPRSLVLFDELGAGTDPEEGVAIAMSLLDHFIEKGCLCLATTHHGILKNYGYTRQGVENAAMEFDVQNLQPTFHIIMGIPGESHALEIARRSGIPEALIARAQAYLKKERGEVSELIDRLSAKQRKLIQAEAAQTSRETQLKEKTRQTDLRELRLRQKEVELREHGLGDLQRLLTESRREYEQLAQRLRNTPDPEARKEALGFFHKLEALAREKEEELSLQQEELYRSEDFPFQKGMEVVIRSTGKRGRILRKGKANTWVVATDTLRGSFPPSELRPAPEEEPPEAIALSISEELNSGEASYQLDLRGLRLEEALRKLEQQLDRAVLRGLSEFSVIHGLGEGVLQRGIHLYLKQCKAVKDYHFSTPEEGGFGKTIVKLA